MDMTPERWQQLKEILATALEMGNTQRAAYTKRISAGDPPLGGELERLLAANAEVRTDFLSGAPAYEDLRDGSPLSGTVLIGRRIGAYEIVQQIGSGGMGEVYRAVRADKQYSKEVAIKVVRAGQDSRIVVRRFKNERQILASLDHPNIARLLDGGTTEQGVPYFVMELIEGLPIDEFCDNHRFTIAERLNLFTKVCSAVQYAHQHLIIHRDIKPGNILVTSAGMPKLLDFGIAKILDPTTVEGQPEPTLTIVRALTPRYASPEQMTGATITTASDIYSLGVVLYELLTGRAPYRLNQRTPQEIARAVCESEPEKPSAAVCRREVTGGGDQPATSAEAVSEARASSPEKLARMLSGDLDTIVLMALRKEPQRRYTSVEQLLEDLRRHHASLPVIARKDTIGYHASKFISRHKLGVALTAVLTTLLISALVATIREARIARAERRRAEQRFNDVRELARSNLFEIHDAIEKLPGSAAARYLVIQRSLQYLDRLSQEAAGNRDLLRELAVGYERIAGLQGNFSGPGIGDSRAAFASYQKALSIRDALVAGSNNDPKELRSEVPLLGAYVTFSLKTGRTEEASRTAWRELSIAEQLLQKQPHDVEARFDAARAHLLAASVLGGTGTSPSSRKIFDAIDHDRQALNILAQFPRAASNGNAARAISIARIELAFHLTKARKFEAAAELFDELISDQKQLPATRDTMLAYNYRGLMYDRLRDPTRAFADFQECSRIAESLFHADPHDLVAEIGLHICAGDAGLERARLGKKSTGLTQLKAAIESGEQLLASDATESFYKSLLLVGYSYEAEILSLMGDQAEAQAKYLQALATATTVSHDDPQDLEARLSVAKIHGALGVVLARATRYGDAPKEFSDSLSAADALLRDRPADAETMFLSATVHDSVVAIKDCLDGRSCARAKQLEVPNLNN